MIRKTTLLALLLISGLSFGQTVINDFETGSSTPVQRYGAEIQVVSNPNSNGNSSANVLEIRRTTTLWYELAAFDLPTPYTVPAGEIHYLTFQANYPASPDISIRIDAADASADGTGSQRTINSYDASSSGEWQTMVFEVDGGGSGTTVNAIVFLADVGFQNNPAGRVLNNTDSFGYVDNFAFSTSNPLSTDNFSLANNLKIYPNEILSTFNIDVQNTNITKVVVYNVLGKDLTKNIVKVSNTQYDMSSLTKGMYLAKIYDDQGNSVTKKLIKK